MIEIILALAFSHLAVAYLVYLWRERAWSRTVILRCKQCRVAEDNYGLVYRQYPVEPGLSYRYELAGGVEARAAEAAAASCARPAISHRAALLR